MQCEKFKFLKTNAKWYLIKSEWNESWMDMKFSRYFLINFSKLIIFHEINPFVLFSSAIWPNLSPRYSAIFRESHSRNYFKWPSNCSKLRICSFLSLSLLLFRKTPSNKMFVIKLRCSTFFFSSPWYFFPSGLDEILYVPFPAFLSRDRSKKSNFEPARSIESSDLCLRNNNRRNYRNN